MTSVQLPYSGNLSREKLSWIGFHRENFCGLLACTYCLISTGPSNSRGENSLTQNSKIHETFLS